MIGNKIFFIFVIFRKGFCGKYYEVKVVFLLEFGYWISVFIF